MTMDKKNNNPKINVKIQKNSDGASFSVPINRFSKVRKLQRKLKNLQGIRMVDQTLLLLPSRRELRVEESINTLLSPDQLELNLLLVVASSANDVQRKQPQMPEKFVPSQDIQGVEGSDSILASPTSGVVGTSANNVSPASNAAVSMTTVVLKISFQDHHRRLPFEHYDAAGEPFSRLAEACTRFFGVKNVHRMVITYRDEDGDRVQLSTDAELTYALTHHAQPSVHGLPVLRLQFSVKPSMKMHDEAPCDVPTSSITTKESKAIATTRKIKDGDVLVLQAQREGELLNLAFSNKDQTVIAATRRPVDDVKVRKNLLWIVEKCPNDDDKTRSDSSMTEEDSSTFFLSCKAFPKNQMEKDNKKKGEMKPQKHLRVLPNGQVNHHGGRGTWARFVITSHSDGQVSLRSIGRSKNHPENNFLGIVKNNNQQFVVAGDLKEGSDNAKFTLQFV